MDKIQPIATPLSQPYWDGCKQGLLRLQYCPECRRYQFYPRILCSSCARSDLQWVDVSGKGTIASFTIVARAVSKAYQSPYVIALVDLDEGPRMMSSIVDIADKTIKIGSRVSVAFEQWSDEITMPVFRIL